MKNRVLGTLMALMMVVALAGPAAAAWEYEMVGVVYNPTGTVEYGFNMGEITSDIAPDGPLWKTIAPAGTVSIEEPFGPTAQWSDLYFGMFSNHMITEAQGNKGYYVSTSSTQPSVGNSVALAFDSAAMQVTDVWSGLIYGPGQTYTNPTQSISFVGQFRQGEYAGVNLAPATGVVNLGGFADPQADVIAEMYIYAVERKANFKQVIASPYSNDFDYYGKLRVLSDGSIQVSAVPVPGAIVLLGSGLLALVGMRRKVS